MDLDDVDVGLVLVHVPAAVLRADAAVFSVVPVAHRPAVDLLMVVGIGAVLMAGHVAGDAVGRVLPGIGWLCLNNLLIYGVSEVPVLVDVGLVMIQGLVFHSELL